MTTQWEDVEVPRGQYIGWGFHPGQTVTGKVLLFSMTGGNDIHGNPCPQLSLELTEACDSYRDKGTTRERIEGGQLVVVNGGLVSLKRALTAAQPEAGDLIKLEFASLVPVKDGEVKEFKVKIARGAGGPATARPASSSAGANPYQTQGEPPF